MIGIHNRRTGVIQVSRQLQRHLAIRVTIRHGSIQGVHRLAIRDVVAAHFEHYKKISLFFWFFTLISNKRAICRHQAATFRESSLLVFDTVSRLNFICLLSLLCHSLIHYENN